MTALSVYALLLWSAAAPPSPTAYSVRTPDLAARLDRQGRLLGLTSVRAARGQEWLSAPAGILVRDEVTGEVSTPPSGPVRVIQEWRAGARALEWTIRLRRDGTPVGHEITVELPLLSPQREVFTPGERGVMRIGDYPTHRPAAYGTYGWGTGSYYVLPLVSVLDPRTGAGLTVALAPDQTIPHLQVEWKDARVLRLILGHRAIGGDLPATIRVLLYGHEDDYRSAIRAYSDDFPRWFRPGLPRGEVEGAFWYHHIQDHPDFAEMKRQNVRWMWSSFWFPYLGEYLPAETEWAPYTCAQWWKLGERMSDEHIRRFTREMNAAGIAVTAYMNLTEYGGVGGERGDSAAGDAMLKGRFAAARVVDANGRFIDTWGGAQAVNPRKDGPLYAHVMEQADRHLERLPELAGFTVDRLDWCSVLDYGRPDGVSMVGDRSAQLLAGPVGEALTDLCARAHARGKRVIANQFWRVEMLRDVDGYCHEYDFPRGIGYLSPYRPAAAWHARVPYSGDLLPFEAQLKARLQWALQPQMIAHQFPISQQAPNPRAADLLELYAPLFGKLLGADQVLEPHCVSVEGTNEANLFRGPRGYVVPVTSRLTFVGRGVASPTAPVVRLRVHEAGALAWAHAYPLESAPYRAAVRRRAGEALVRLARHRSATVLVVGSGPEPALDPPGLSGAELRARLAPNSWPQWVSRGSPSPTPPRCLSLSGWMVGEGGPVRAYLGGRLLGEVTNGGGSWEITPTELAADALELRRGDEGAWFVPEHVSTHPGPGPVSPRRRGWDLGDPAEQPDRWTLRLPLRVVRGEERYEPQDGVSAVDALGPDAAAKATLGATAAFVAGRSPLELNGFRLRVRQGRPFAWAQSVADPRVPRIPDERPDASVPATCWFDERAVVLSLNPPDDRPYRLSLWLVDYDRHGREADLLIGDASHQTSATHVSAAAYGEGTILRAEFRGTAWIVLRCTKGLNTTLSGIYADRP